MNENHEEIVNSQKLLKVNEVVQQLNVSRALVYRLINERELRAVRIKNAKRVRQEDLDEFIENHLTI